MIDVQVNLPAVLPCSHLGHATRQLSRTLLVRRDGRQQGTLRVARPGERSQPLLCPVEPVQIIGLQERRNAEVLGEDTAWLSPVWERIPADISTENGPGEYFILIPHVVQNLGRKSSS